jgi:hypothetical protein
MSGKTTKLWPAAALGCLAVSLLSTGCATTVGGQTLPSAWYLRDDIQYYPPGPEMKLQRQVDAIEEYNARRANALGGAPAAGRMR